MRVQILNWDKFNPRKDVKNPSWFRLSHNLFEDPDFYDFSHAELLAWIYILSTASKKNSDTILVSLTHLEKIGRIKLKDFYSAVEKLEVIQCLLVHVTDTSRGRHADVTDTNATNERTNERNGTGEYESSDSLPTPAWLGKMWNEHCGKLPKVKFPEKLDPDRVKAAKDVLALRPDKELWIAAIKKMAASDFCLGKKNSDKHKTWRAKFDFLIRTGTIDRALEGEFDNEGPTQNPSKPSAAALEIMREAGVKNAV